MDSSRLSRTSRDHADEARLAPAEQARIDHAVVAVGRGHGTGPVLVATLVVVAFLVGLVRPWDWLAGDPATGARTGDGVSDARSPGGGGNGPGVFGGPSVPDATGPAGGAGGGAPAPIQAPTCGYPTSWRTATTRRRAPSSSRRA